MRKRIAVLAVAALAAASGTAALGLGTGSSGAASSATSGLDQQYLMTSAEGDAFEIIGGKLALKKSSNPKVRKLATTLVKDHSKSLKETKTMAKALGVKVEAKPSPSQAWELGAVASRSGSQFDKWYASLEVQDHKQDITEAAFEQHHGSNSSVRSSAKKEIPTLRKHLKLAKAALK